MKFLRCIANTLNDGFSCNISLQRAESVWERGRRKQMSWRVNISQKPLLRSHRFFSSSSCCCTTFAIQFRALLDRNLNRYKIVHYQSLHTINHICGCGCIRNLNLFYANSTCNMCMGFFSLLNFQICCTENLVTVCMLLESV